MLEKIKQALGEELSKKVEEVLGEKGIELGIFNDGSLVPSEKYDKLKSDKKAIEEELSTTQTKLSEFENKVSELSKSGDEKETLQKSLESVKSEFEKFKQESEKRQTDTVKRYKALEMLNNENVLKDSADLLLSEIKLDDLKLNNNSIENWEEVIKPIKEKRPSLFGEKITESQGTPNTKSNGVSKIDGLINLYNEAEKKGDVKQMIKIQNQIKKENKE